MSEQPHKSTEQPPAPESTVTEPVVAAPRTRQPRPSWVNTLIITIASLLLAFIVAAVVMVFSDA